LEAALEGRAVDLGAYQQVLEIRRRVTLLVDQRDEGPTNDVALVRSIGGLVRNAAF
jgi:hypothetical protein